MHSSFESCHSCSRRKYGFCHTMLEVINRDLESHIVQQQQLAAKHYLFRQGELLKDLYVLQSGFMLLIRVDIKGKRQVLKLIFPGDLLGFQPEIDGPTIYSAITVVESKVCWISDAIHLCSKYPELAMRIARVSANDMLLMEMHLAKISRYSASERISFLMLEIFLRLKQRGLTKGAIIQGNRAMFALNRTVI